MLNIIQNTIGAIRRVGESVVRAGLKMWLPFTKAEPLGENLVVNGDFATDSDWEKVNATISDNKATINVVNGGLSYISHNISFVSGKTYKLNAKFRGLGGSSGKEIRFQDNSANIGGLTTTNGLVTLDESLQDVELVWTANSNSNRINIVRHTSVGDYSFEIISISVEEYAQETSDISGNDNNAILKTGKALVFAGNDSVETSFPSSKTIKTIAFWIYPTHSAQFETLFNLGMTNIPVSPLGDRVIQLNHLTISNKQHFPLNFDVYIDGVYRGETTYNGDNPTLDINQWQRVVLVNSNGTSTVNDTFDIAYTGSGSHGRFKMSDLQIYGAEFTTDDIAYDYANPQKLVTDNASSNVTLNDLHAWWHMSEGDGTIAFDSAPLIGKEIFQNPDFNSTTGWGGTADWIIDTNLGTATYNLGYANRNLNQSGSVVNGATLQVEVTVDTIDDGSVNIYDFTTGQSYGTITTIGTHKFVFNVSSTTKPSLRSNSTNVVVSYFSLKEVYNIDGETYHGSSLGATYDDAQERIPQLGMMNWSKGSNLIEYSEDFTEWTLGVNATLTYESDVVAPDGTVGVYRLLLPAQGATYLQSPTYAAGSGMVFSLWVKKTDNNNTDFYFYDGTTVSSTLTATNDWQRFEVNSFTGNQATIINSGDTFISDIYIWGGQVESGTTASAYRRTNGTAVTDATLISCATDSQKDILGNAVRVKGSGFNLDGTGYGEVPNDTSINPTPNISFSCWFYSNSENDKGLLSKWRNGSGYMLYKQTNTLRGYINGTFKTTTTIPQTGWIYACCTFDGSNIKVYTIVPNDLDAQGNQIVNVAVQPYSSTITNSSDELEIGRYNLQIGSEYSNIIDDAQVYGATLTQSEILQNFNATKSGHNN